MSSYIVVVGKFHRLRHSLLAALALLIRWKDPSDRGPLREGHLLGMSAGWHCKGLPRKGTAFDLSIFKSLGVLFRRCPDAGALSTD